VSLIGLLASLKELPQATVESDAIEGELLEPSEIVAEVTEVTPLVLPVPPQVIDAPEGVEL